MSKFSNQKISPEIISHYLELLNSHLPKKIAIKIKSFSKDDKNLYKIDELNELSGITFTQSEIYKSILFATQLIMKFQQKNPETEGVTEQPLFESTKKSSKLSSKSPTSKKYGFSVPKTSATMADNNKDDSSLNIPQVPSRKKIASNSDNIKVSAEIENDITSSNPDIKKILIECQICKKVIRMPVPKKLIEESPLPVTDVTYVHGDPPHAVTAQLDRDFEVRRRRSAPVIFQDKSKL